MELRKDYFLDRWVIIAGSRQTRPKQFIENSSKHDSTCFFCPGNESLTPPEIGRINSKKHWKMRWFPNKFPITTQNGNPQIDKHNEYFTFASAFGSHEVLVETNDHDKQLWDLPSSDIEQIFKIYRQRINFHLSKKNISFVTVFKNHGSKAGTSLVHSHSQLVSQNFIPQIIKQKINLNRDICHYCKIIDIEKNSDRRCFENDTFIAFTPYASRFNYEIWLMPQNHITHLNDLTKKELIDLSKILKKILNKLKSANLPYNFYLQYSPNNDSLHFHVEIIPRQATWAGFEYASDTIINAVSPEDAAKFYRD